MAVAVIKPTGFFGKYTFENKSDHQDKLDTLTELIFDVENYAYCVGEIVAKKGTCAESLKWNKELIKAKIKAFKVIDQLRK